MASVPHTLRLDQILHPNQKVENDNSRWYTEGKSNPNLPGPIFGVKFDDTSGAAVVIDLDSPRAPIWGDFFAKGGLGAGLVSWLRRHTVF